MVNHALGTVAAGLGCVPGVAPRQFGGVALALGFVVGAKLFDLTMKRRHGVSVRRL